MWRLLLKEVRQARRMNVRKPSLLWDLSDLVSVAIQVETKTPRLSKYLLWSRP